MKIQCYKLLTKVVIQLAQPCLSSLVRSRYQCCKAALCVWSMRAVTCIIFWHSASAGRRKQASEHRKRKAPEATVSFAKRQKSKAAVSRQKSPSAESDAASDKSTSQRRASARVRKPSSKSIAAGRTLQEPKRTSKSRSVGVKRATRSDPASKAAAMDRSHQTPAQPAAVVLKRKAAVQPNVQADKEQEPTGAARNSKSRRQYRTASANRAEAIAATPKRTPRDSARKKQASFFCCVL